VHPFLLSHEEKWPCLDLSMKGGHGQTSSSMGNHGGAHRRGRGGGRGVRCGWGVVGEAARAALWFGPTIL
jgi:hypothetical protein